MILSSALLLIFATAFVTNSAVKGGNDIEYVCEEDGDHIMLKSNGALTYVDLSDCKTEDIYTGLSYIESYGVLELDSYVLTAYSKDLHIDAPRLATCLYIKKIYAPAPESDDEKEIAELMITEFSSLRCELVFYESEEFLIFGEHTLFPAFRTTLGDKNRCSVIIFDGDNVISYLSSGMLKDETKNVAIPLIDGCNTLILGRHGDSYKDYSLILKFNGIERLVISSENFEISDDVIEHYADTEIITSPEKLSLKR